MTLRKFLAALALGAALCPGAHAVVLDSFSTATGNIVTDFSAPGLLSFDLDLARPEPLTRLVYAVEDGDGLQIAFNAIIRNFFGLGIDHVKLFLEGATFLDLGSAQRAFGAAPVVSGGGAAARIDFNPREFVEFFIGDPLADLSGTDWTISLAGLETGDTFSLSVAVPAPATLPLMLAGLPLVLVVARRRLSHPSARSANGSQASSASSLRFVSSPPA